MIGDEVTVGGAGTCAFMPRGVPHAWKSTGAETARVLFLYTPATVGGLLEERHRTGRNFASMNEQNEAIRVTRNRDYWKPERPYLDGIEWTIIPNRSTALLAFVAGKLDMTFPYEVTVPLLKDIESQAPQAICELRPRGVSSTLIVNRNAAPFDNPDLRRAMALTLDRRSFIDVLSGGQGDIGGAMLPPPEGQWGMPPERLRALLGYDPDVQKNRGEAREIMQRLGYGPDNPLAVKVAAIAREMLLSKSRATRAVRVDPSRRGNVGGGPLADEYPVQPAVP